MMKRSLAVVVAVVAMTLVLAVPAFAEPMGEEDGLASEGAELASEEVEPTSEGAELVPSAVASRRPIADGLYTIASALAPGKVLDVAGGNVGDGANIQIWSANGTAAQKFWVRWEPQGFYSIRSLLAGKSLDVDSGRHEPSTNIHQWTYASDNTSQQWSIAPVEGGFAVTAAVSGLALDVAAGVSADGTNVQLWDANATPAQAFTFEKTEPLGEGVFCVAPVVNQGVRLDVAGGSRDNGANVQVWEDNATAAQKFHVRRIESGVYALSSLRSGHLVSASGGNVVMAAVPDASAAGASVSAASQWKVVAGGLGIAFENRATGQVMAVDQAAGAASGSNVGLSAKTPGADPLGFSFVPTDMLASGTYTISNVGTGCVVDIAGGGSANGTNVQVWAGNDTPAQKWNVKNVGDGWYSIENVRIRSALDVNGGGAASGTNVQIWDVAVTPNQRFRLVPTGDGYFYLEAMCNGLRLTAVPDGGEGANLVMATALGATDPSASMQKFDFTATTFVFTVADVRASIDSASPSGGLAPFGGFNMSADTAARLQGAVDGIHRRGSNVGFVLVDLATGQGVSCNPDADFYSASTLKGPYVASLACKNPGSVNGWLGVMSNTIRWSSNDDYARLWRNFGPGSMYEWCAEAGVDQSIASTKYKWLSTRELCKLWLRNYEFFTSGEANSWIGDLYTTPNESVVKTTVGASCATWSKAGWYYEGRSRSTSEGGVVWSAHGPYLVTIMSDVPGNFAALRDVMWALDAAHASMR